MSRLRVITQILIDKNGMIAGSRVDVYLLEKSRIVHQADGTHLPHPHHNMIPRDAPERVPARGRSGERNYHVFYQLLASSSIPDTLRTKLGLKVRDSHTKTDGSTGNNGVHTKNDGFLKSAAEYTYVNDVRVVRHQTHLWLFSFGGSMDLWAYGSMDLCDLFESSLESGKRPRVH